LAETASASIGSVNLLAPSTQRTFAGILISLPQVLRRSNRDTTSVIPSSLDEVNGKKEEFARGAVGMGTQTTPGAVFAV
jgi:hypothetical protein